MRQAAAVLLLFPMLLVAGAQPGVAVSAPTTAALWPRGQVRLSPSVRCSPNYRVAELYVRVSQPGGAAAQAYRVPVVTCDGAWHRVPTRVPTTTSRPLEPGPATIEALVYAQSGNGPPTAAKDTRAATLARHRG